MTRQVLVLVSCAALGATTVLSAPQEGEDEQRSVQVGVYSEEQAVSGEEVYAEACLVCHQPEEFSVGGYMEGWVGRNAHDFLEVIRTTMPEDNPGRLKRREYIELVAYLFKMNGLPVGDEPLRARDLKLVIIEGPFGRSSTESGRQ